ncbi:hypothetical protein BDV95DRAFT_570539 [Massariosphaeria phaeospora]|uniref:Uncharacterized protein n=1 Tax=Massariosphaeria phaeospora TaxID=100035 RepID=A0A7C8I7R3_9PLEO|nr:hypothetical protein BDV95DRAFT_570539 [Massariosphaeria phaeospora]
MDSLTTHPSTAAQAKTFVAPGSLSYPAGAIELTPLRSENSPIPCARAHPSVVGEEHVTSGHQRYCLLSSPFTPIRPGSRRPNKHVFHPPEEERRGTRSLQ